MRIRSELVKYFLLRRALVGVLLECNFPPDTAGPHIEILEKEGLMGFQSGVHVLADLGLLSHAGSRADETWSKHSNAHDGRVRAGRVSEGQGEETYCIERGKALYSSADIILSPARLNMTGSFSPLRRRLRVTLCKSGVLLDFDDDEVVGGVVGKQPSRRRRVAVKAARLSLSVPAGPACCCVCAAASRKTIITMPCLGDGPRRMHRVNASWNVRSRHAQLMQRGQGVAWRGLQ